MKTLTKLSACIIIVLLAACTKKQEIINTSLVGTWRLDATYMDPGNGGGTYQPVANPGNNGISLSANGTIKVSGLNDSDNFLLYFSQYQSYTIKDSVTLVFKKQAGTAPQNFLYKIEGNKLTLSPAGPIMCIEGCGIRFKKVE
jgi:hypothetical protein